jgi:hypothetical protein
MARDRNTYAKRQRRRRKQAEGVEKRVMEAGVSRKRRNAPTRLALPSARVSDPAARLLSCGPLSFCRLPVI